MPIISKIGHKSLKTRVLFAAMYAFLLVGSISMIYPFLLLISGSTKSAVDTPETFLLPPFIRSEKELYKKYIEGLFNEKIDEMRMAYQLETPAFKMLQTPEKINAKFASEWELFLNDKKLPVYFYESGFLEATTTRGVIPQTLREFKEQMSKRYDGDISKLNKALQCQFPSWAVFFVRVQNFINKFSVVGNTPWDESYLAFKQGVPFARRYYFSTDGFYKELFLKPQYPGGVSQFNKAHGTAFSSFSELRLSQTFPISGTQLDKNEWEDFVRNIIHPRWLRVSTEVAPAYRAYLQDRYMDDIKLLNEKYGTSFAGFKDIDPISGVVPEFGIQASDWVAFLQGWKDPDSGKEYKIPAEFIRIESLDFVFRNWLKSKYGQIELLNKAMDVNFRTWDDILPPQRDYHYIDFKNHTGHIRKEFIVRNFLTVFDYLFSHGRALVNTVIYCLLTISCSLIVNPLAAYALSRFKPPSSYKILLFLMLTMAFPPVVTQIPNFLMLRELNLLNTFFALILPGLANGYSVFLLKGFFDSLPQELYECASLDGASEPRIFLSITMSLSKPILAVIALGAFTAAYGNFMMALLVCQDRNMWTIMPFLYELQQNSGQGVIFASLLVASVPTLIIFIVAQDVIMKGIVVPVEK